jgi:predicted transcriptional regulator
MREQQEFIFRKKLFIEDCIFDIHNQKKGIQEMKGRARVLDSRYLEFIEYLKKLGEQENLMRMIHRLSNPEYDAVETAKTGLVMEMGEADKMIYSFWQKGWIEIREMEKTGKDGLDKEYILKVRLGRIVDYFAQERLERSARAESSFSMPRIPVLT